MSAAIQRDVRCGECRAPMRLRDSRYGKFYSCTRWPECDGKHGAHPDGSPLGIPAPKAVREARIAAHDAFDAWRARAGVSRKAAYRWLAEAMQLSTDDAHIGRFTAEQCADLVSRCAGPEAGTP